MKKLLFLTLVACLTVLSSFAVPAKKGVKKVITLQDGSRVEATLVGDEHVNFYQTEDHRAIQLVDGAYRVVNRDSLLRLHTERMTLRNKVRASRLPGARKTEYVGQKKGLVILVQFNDVKFTYDTSVFNDFFNKPGFNQDGMKGSVHDYFLSQSYGQFDLEFDVVGPVTVGQNASYYATDNKRVATMVNDLCKNVDSEVDFSVYDWDGDDVVDQVYVIYAGYGKAQGAENTIWPHEWTVRGGSTPYVTGEKKRIDTYGISCELMGNGENYPGHLDGIGTSCHEFSHCLGLPDFYDVGHNDGTSGNYGMGNWDLMDSGCYSGENNGRCPIGYSAYERWFGGWLEPTELSSSRQVIDMPSIEDEPVAYILYNDAYKSEYYLLANYQQTDFNAYAPGHGLLVVHVDYDASAWNGNQVNADGDHQRMTLIPADNTLSSSTEAADPFPGTRRKTALTNTSTPKASLYHANVDGKMLMSKPLTNISEVNGLVSFDVMGGVPIDVPVVHEATNVSGSAFTANWDAVEGATSYTVLLSKTVSGDNPDDMIAIEEDFSGFADLTSSLSTDISSQLDQYTVQTGWTGKNVYAHNKKLRVGKASTAGELRTPKIAAPTQNSITVLLGVTNAAKSGEASIQFRLEIPGGGYAYADLDNIPVASDELHLHLMNVDSWSYGEFYAGIYPVSTGTGVYAEYLAVYDGLYTWEDLNAAPALIGGLPENVLAKAKVLNVEWKQSDELLSTVPAPRMAPVTTETTYVTTNTSYDFTDLKPALYSYKVRVTTAAGLSGWSDEVTVDLTDAIQSVTAARPLGDNRTYLLDGRQLNGHAALRSGIYIRDGKKFVVK